MKKYLPKYYTLVTACILALYGCYNFYCSTRLSVNGDENVYYAYGANILKGHPEKKTADGRPLFNSQTPINAINAFPRAVQAVLHPNTAHDTEQAHADIKLARMFSIISSLLLGLYVVAWATRLYGRKGGLLALLLYVLCPNIAAHSQMLGNDVYSFLVCTATCYHAWRYARTRRFKQWILVAMWLAVGQITKQSLLLLYPIMMLFSIMALWLVKYTLKTKLGLFFKQWITVIVLSLAIINAGYLFNHTGQSLGDHHFVSRKFQGLQATYAFAKNWPIPLPQPYIDGFDIVNLNMETGPGIDGLSSFGQASFMGKKITSQIIPYYYIVSLWFKLPIAFIVVLLTSLTWYFSRKKKIDLGSDTAFLLLPAFVILFSFSLLNNMYLGSRSVMMILPLLYIFCGSIFTTTYFSKRLTNILIILLLLYEAISVGLYFPHVLPYTNEFIWDKKYAYKKFDDSNIYYQEGWYFAEAYLQQHPETRFQPATQVHGKVMVSLEAYDDWFNTGTMQWLRDLHLHPIDHVDSQYLIFDVPERM